LAAITVIETDLASANHHRDFLAMMDSYARDPMEGGLELSADVRRELIPRIRQHPTFYAFLAYDDDKAIGFCLCFLGFSSFAARPLLNIHDIGVLPEYRGHGVGLKLMTAVEDKARSLGCCKLTLEVREDNDRARRLYRKLGFAESVVGPARIAMEFWSKPF
jgi:ribosomal protein S18 acetylase RimI-like enzyme